MSPQTQRENLIQLVRDATNLLDPHNPHQLVERMILETVNEWLTVAFVEVSADIDREMKGLVERIMWGDVDAESTMIVKNTISALCRGMPRRRREPMTDVELDVLEAAQKLQRKVSAIHSWIAAS